MSKKCRAYSESKLGLGPADNRKAFYAGWDAALREALASPQPAQQEIPKIGCVNHDCDKCKAQQQQQQEPVAVYVGETWCGSVVSLYEELPLETPLYTSPPAQRKPLTDEEIKRMAAPWFLSMYWPLCNTFARAIEAAHCINGIKEKNT